MQLICYFFWLSIHNAKQSLPTVDNGQFKDQGARGGHKEPVGLTVLMWQDHRFW